MSTVVIILAVIVILLIYILYRFLKASEVELTASANMNDDITAMPIMTNSTSTKYAYGLWIYVNSWQMGGPKTLFSRDKNIELYLDTNSPTLKCDIFMSNDASKTIEITDNFPIQKWVHIIVSVDNQYADCYLDGKLVKSSRAYTEDEENGIQTPMQPPVGGKDGTKMKLGGNTRFDAYVSRFKHWSSSINPETAWTAYMNGNGQGVMKNWFSAYGLDVLVKKDNIEQTKFSLF
jgi:hypothetical protein|uniref:LamG-like jellyroll fold domain-containing protein n=1 Tax=viral metagenome TaxID=1070528 RepID=A0A6C0IN50_9ZZZZ